MEKAKVLCINPWIVDFAAYDFWSKPLGLLYLAALLRRRGLEISLIDCLDRWHPRLLNRQKLQRPKRRKGGIGPFHREIIAKPACLEFMPRHFARYGLPLDIFQTDLKNTVRPDVILMTSGMTYWYPGVALAAQMCREVFPGVPIVLGGIYATLMPAHAEEHIDADFILPGPGEQYLLPLLADLLDRPALAENPPQNLDQFPSPAFDLLHGVDYFIAMATRGCPLSCTFCATHKLSDYRLRERQPFVQELLTGTKQYGVCDIAFYDDALLMQAEKHIKPILRDLISARVKLNLHAPNGLHARFIDVELANLMRQSGFRTIRLSLESVAVERRRDIHNKITPGEFTTAVQNLVASGYAPRELETYVIMALPGQEIDEVIETICYAHRLGVRVRLCSYSPIPGTADYQRAIACGDFPPDADPLLTNKTIVPLYRTTKAYFRYQRISQFTHWLNEKAWQGEIVREANAQFEPYGSLGNLSKV